MRPIYLDYAATTPVLPEVLEVANRYCLEQFGNPSSLHEFGFEAKKAIEHTRSTVARFIGASASESIIFTSSATESNNLAIQGLVLNIAEKPVHIITSETEHSSVYNVCTFLQGLGHDVTFLPVDSYGRVSPKALNKNIKPDTALISIHYANSETGVIQDIETIGEIALKSSMVFHTDAVQPIGRIQIDVLKSSISMLSCSAHKLYSIKGAGFLLADMADIRLRLVQRNIRLEADDSLLKPLMYGGSQEEGLRPSTENVPAITAMSKAIEIAAADMTAESQRQKELREYFIGSVLERIPGTDLNGSRQKRLPNNCNLCFRGVNAYELMLLLDRRGIACSIGSACTSHSEKPSRVLTATVLTSEEAAGSLRFILGRYTTLQDLDYAVEEIRRCVGKLNKVSSVARSW